MEHPFIDPADLSTKSLEDLQTTMAGLSNKLNYAYRTGNGPLINQLNMALDSYRQAFGRKMDDVFSKQNIHPRISIEKDSK